MLEEGITGTVNGDADAARILAWQANSDEMQLSYGEQCLITRSPPGVPG
jgi:hypothetical protein